MGVDCLEEFIKRLANRLHCFVCCLLIKYLRLPIGLNLRSKRLWCPIVKKFEKKLSLWKRNYVSFLGGITLSKHFAEPSDLQHVSL